MYKVLYDNIKKYIKENNIDVMDKNFDYNHLKNSIISACQAEKNLSSVIIEDALHEVIEDIKEHYEVFE